jgi:hypothetical protein
MDKSTQFQWDLPFLFQMDTTAVHQRLPEFMETSAFLPSELIEFIRLARGAPSVSDCQITFSRDRTDRPQLSNRPFTDSFVSPRALIRRAAKEPLARLRLNGSFHKMEMTAVRFDGLRVIQSATDTRMNCGLRRYLVVFVSVHSDRPLTIGLSLRQLRYED